MAIIKSPNKSYTGVSASVSFCNGIGMTNSAHLIRWFKSHGYEVAEEEKDTDITKMRKEELEKLAATLGIETETTMTRDTIIKLIREHRKESDNKADAGDTQE